MGIDVGTEIAPNFRIVVFVVSVTLQHDYFLSLTFRPTTTILPGL